jgi:hypothetical protein
MIVLLNLKSRFYQIPRHAFIRGIQIILMSSELHSSKTLTKVQPSKSNAIDMRLKPQ